MSPDPLDPSRRYFLGQCTGLSLGAMALSTLVGRALAAEGAGKPGLANLPHFRPKAKRVIFLTQSGGPSQIELFDEKPGLAKLAGTELPESVRQGQRLTTMTSGQKQLIKPAATKFARCGQSGQNIGEWLPHLRTVADELCVVRSMHTDQINHAPAMTQFLTGHQIPGRPSVGAWASYGLGSENRNLPDYLVLLSKMQRPSDQPLYDHYWGSGFLPSRFQGVNLRSAKDAVLYLRDREGLPRDIRRGMLDGLAERARGLRDDEARDDDQDQALDHGRDVLELLVAERVRRVRRPVGGAHREQRDHRGQQVRERVRGLGEDRRRARGERDGALHGHARPRQGDAEPRRVALRRGHRGTLPDGAPHPCSRRA